MASDNRLPIRFGPLEARRLDEAVLTDGSTEVAAPAGRFTPASPRHAVGCMCCAPRSATAVALARLFRARANADTPAFRGVLAVVTASGEAAVRDALASDLVVSARYRLSDEVA